MGAWGPQPHQIGSLAINQSTTAGRQLVASLGPLDTSWTAPRASKYTIYAWGPGGRTTPSAFPGGGSGLARITVSLAKGSVLTLSIGQGAATSGTDGAGYDPSGPTTVSGPGVSLNVTAGGAGSGAAAGPGGTATGGDLNLTGSPGNGGNGDGGAAASDGTLFGKGGRSASQASTPYGGETPGAGARLTGGSISWSGSGLVRIVDETP